MTSQSFNLDLIPKGVNPVVNVSQYDAGQTWTIGITENGNAFSIPSGASVTICGTKRDSTGFMYACTFSGSTVTAIVQPQMTILSGDQKAELRITKGAEKIATINFIIRVEPSALSDSTQISETELPLIEQAVELMNEAPQIIAQMEGLEQDAEAWAKGTKNGAAVPSSAEQYHNSSYWYAMQAAAVAAHAPIIGNNGNWWVGGVDTGETLVLSEGNEWTDSFTDLDKFEKGEVIVYTVQELTVPGYNTVITGSQTEGYTITNSHTPETVSVDGREIIIPARRMAVMRINSFLAFSLFLKW